MITNFLYITFKLREDIPKWTSIWSNLRPNQKNAFWGLSASWNCERLKQHLAFKFLSGNTWLSYWPKQIKDPFLHLSLWMPKLKSDSECINLFIHRKWSTKALYWEKPQLNNSCFASFASLAFLVRDKLGRLFNVISLCHKICGY